MSTIDITTATDADIAKMLNDLGYISNDSIIKTYREALTAIHEGDYERIVDGSPARIYAHTLINCHD